ncbi:MAG: DUF2752 domain-containing protein [Candidatus Riflebacteria bacterium]|nr:DUF2752 domain-containing protein [Candidatus Riflebacteria bacterium]
MQSERVNHLAYLRLAIAIIYLSLLSDVSSINDDCIKVFGIKVPAICTSMTFFSTPCPGCGLTRSFAAAAHGNIDLASKFNRTGLALFLLVVFQLPYRLIKLKAPQIRISEKIRPFLLLPSYSILIMLIVNWFILQMQ